MSKFQTQGINQILGIKLKNDKPDLLPCSCGSNDLRLYTKQLKEIPTLSYSNYICNNCGNHSIVIVEPTDNTPSTAKKVWNRYIRAPKVISEHMNIL